MPHLGQAYALTIGGVTVGLLTSFTLNNELGTVEINNFDDPDFANYLGTMIDWSIDFDALYSVSNTGQQAALTAQRNKIAVAITLASTQIQFAGDGIVTNFTISGETNNPTEVSGSIQGSGELSITPAGGS